jgi:hypothetical protein
MTIRRYVFPLCVAAFFVSALASCGQARTPEIDFEGSVGDPNAADLQYRLRLVTVAGDKGNVVACGISTTEVGKVQSSLTHLSCGGTQVDCQGGRVARFQFNLNGWLNGTFVGADPAKPLIAHYVANELNNRFDLAPGDPASLPASVSAVPAAGSGKAIAECAQDGSLWTSVISGTP